MYYYFRVKFSFIFFSPANKLYTVGPAATEKFMYNEEPGRCSIPLQRLHRGNVALHAAC